MKALTDRMRRHAPLWQAWFAALAMGVALSAGTVAQAQPAAADEAAAAQARSLLNELNQADDFRTWFDLRKASFTKEQAFAMEQIAMRTANAGRQDVAMVASSLSALMYRHLQQPEGALRSAWLRMQLSFQKAETARQYEEVRSLGQTLLLEAVKLKQPEQAFHIATLAADAAYFQSRAPDVTGNERENPAQTLADILVAFEHLTPEPQRVWFERLLSLTATTLHTAGSRYFLEQDAIEKTQRALVPLLQSRVPVDFAYTQLGDTGKSVGTARALASLSYALGDPVQASQRLAVALQRAATLGDPQEEISLLLARYNGERRAKAGPSALRPLRDAAWKRAQTLRNGYRSPAGRISVAQRSDELFGAMLQGELEDRGLPVAEVFARVESLKARMLLDRMAGPVVNELRSETALTLERQVLAFKKADKPDTSLVFEEMRLVSRLASMDGIEDEQRDRAVVELETLYRNAGAGYGAAADVVPLATLQQTLAPEEALIEYIIPPYALHPAQHLWALLVTRQSLKLAYVPLDKALGVSSLTGRISVDGQAPVDNSALGELIIKLRTEIRNASDTQARTRLRALHQLLLEPLQAQGFRPEDYRRLIIVPHGVLHTVPFQALLDASGQFLIAKTEVVVAPSASVWQRLALRRNSLAPALVLANPQLGSRGVAELPFAGQEGQAVARALAPAATLFTGPQATLARLLAGAPGAGVLHLATHGEFPDDSAASDHTLWLADEAGRGGALTAAQVRRLKLEQSRLVVLSVCNGGLVRTGPSDEPYGLVPAFLEAGAANVLGTLWPLDDQFGRDFMTEYYRHLPTRGVAGALRQASLRFIGEDEYLRKWAAFVLVGAGR